MKLFGGNELLDQGPFGKTEIAANYCNLTTAT